MALQRNRRFELRCRQALAARRADDLAALFPTGTYKLRLVGLVRVEPPPL